VAFQGKVRWGCFLNTIILLFPSFTHNLSRNKIGEKNDLVEEETILKTTTQTPPWKRRGLISQIPLFLSGYSDSKNDLGPDRAHIL
jgi:hypothetical protein